MHTHSMFKDTYILNYWGKGEEEHMGPFRREKWDFRSTNKRYENL